MNLDDLRVNEQGYSRSHFRFCRIEYPGKVYSYLLYVKLSLTGNEGEFLRRYRLDEPAFPHHSTADQFFGEAQFEAYHPATSSFFARSLAPWRIPSSSNWSNGSASSAKTYLSRCRNRLHRRRPELLTRFPLSQRIFTAMKTETSRRDRRFDAFISHASKD